MSGIVRRCRAPRDAVVPAVVWAAPAAAAPAAAAQLARTVYPLDPLLVPSVTACAFDVEGEPTGVFIAVTTSATGTEMQSVRARGACVNLDTGAHEYQPLHAVRRFGHRHGRLRGALVAGTGSWRLLARRQPSLAPMPGPRRDHR
jgi:hypothetical protein